MDHGWFFSWNLAKNWIGEQPIGVKLQSTAQLYWLLKLSIRVFSFLFPALTLISSALCAYFNSALALLFSPFLWQEILTIAGHSSPPSQEAGGSGLAESECSALVGVCQQLANKGCCSPPQRLCYIHGKLEVKSLNTVITRAGSLK